MQQPHADENTPAPTPGAEPQRRDPSTEKPTRDAWLARTLEREIHGALHRALLWIERLSDSLDGEGPSGPERQRKLEGARKQLEESLARVDDLVAITRPESASDGSGWPRNIVVRDLLAAAAREVAPELERKALHLERSVDSEDLHLVAEPAWTLKAVTALLKAGFRSARAGERLHLRAALDVGPEATVWCPCGQVVISLRTPRLDLPPGGEVGPLLQGRPWEGRLEGAPGVAITVATVGRLAGFLGGSLELTPADDGEGVTASLRLPAGRIPERRPGWIP